METFKHHRKDTMSIVKASPKIDRSKFWESRTSGHSSSNYWLKDSIFEKRHSYFFDDDETPESTSKYDNMQLAQYQRAISNFVRILTGRNDIKVDYNSGGTSYTDGKGITLSANIKEKEFDTAVGLALHEASHILYTDFDALSKYLWSFKSDMINQRKILINLVEDLYIDAMTYRSAPGYRGYYSSLYQKYFDDKKIVNGLWSRDYTEQTWDNYIFHLINIRNPQRNLQALPGLDHMFKELDLSNITRLKTFNDRLDLSKWLHDEITKYVGATDEDQQPEQLKDQQPDTNPQEETEGTAAPIALDTLSQKEKQQLEKLIDQQKSFIDGDTRKGKVSKGEQKKISVLAAANIDKKLVGANTTFSKNGVPLLIINDISKKFIESFGFHYGISGYPTQQSSERIDVAIARGKLLAKKLQLRNEERSLKTTRLDRGKIDKRLLHEIGFNNADIFQKININTYTPSYIHISIDQSGSMQGSKFDSAMEFAAMFAAASKYINNIHLQISVRSTIRDTHGAKEINAYLMYIFDSKKHNIQNIRSLFPRMRSCNYTPEGLCFAGIMSDTILKAARKEAYFINICDGEPYMELDFAKGAGLSPASRHYHGDSARLHSKSQMRRMENNGINFIAYFIGSLNEFRKVQECYGKNAIHLHSPTEIHKITATMSKSLL